MTKKIFEIRVCYTEWNNNKGLRGWETVIETPFERFAYFMKDMVREDFKVAANEVEVRVRDVKE